MDAHILSIGDELLIGQTTNTNAAWLGRRLSNLGIHVERTVTVRDDQEAMTQELGRAFESARFVLTTGGLGPTHDDITRDVVADYLDCPLETDEDILQRVRAYYEQRNRQMPPSGPALAERPDGFEILDNPVGAAVGLWYHDDASDTLLAVLPGIPAEMKAIFEASVEPRLVSEPDVDRVHHRTLVTAGIGETALQERLGDLSAALGDDVSLAYLPSTSGVRLRLTAETDGVTAEERLDDVESVIRERAGNHLIGTGDVTLEEVLGDMLRSADATIGAAESATGGLIGHRLTGISGSSDYFLGSVVSYANSVKEEVLGVDAEAISEEGAVSESVAIQMAQGARRVLGSTVAVSTTGIAGPTGGRPNKPVGTVWVGYADGAGGRAHRYQFVEDRSLNKKLFASAALDLVRRHLL